LRTRCALSLELELEHAKTKEHAASIGSLNASLAAERSADDDDNTHRVAAISARVMELGGLAAENNPAKPAATVVLPGVGVLPEAQALSIAQAVFRSFPYLAFLKMLLLALLLVFMLAA
jgi:hypothetical protein